MSMTDSKRFFLFFSPSGMPATVCVHLNSVELPRRVEQQNHVTDHPPDVGHHGLRTPNEGINRRNLKFWADVADENMLRPYL